jgi:uncharacterized protein YhaN
MSQIEARDILSDDAGLQVSGRDTECDDEDGLKLVPVGESIRYRKRAQSAEKKAEALAEQLAAANQKMIEISQELDGLQLEQKLTRKLAAAGAMDLEAAVLVAKARMQGKSEADVEGCVERLKREKQYLFGVAVGTAAAKRTAGVKDRVSQSQAVLERAAKRAVRTGSRADLQEYLRLRRNLL